MWADHDQDHGWRFGCGLGAAHDFDRWFACRAGPHLWTKDTDQAAYSPHVRTAIRDQGAIDPVIEPQITISTTTHPTTARYPPRQAPTAPTAPTTRDQPRPKFSIAELRRADDAPTDGGQVG